MLKSSLGHGLEPEFRNFCSALSLWFRLHWFTDLEIIGVYAVMMYLHLDSIF